MVLLEVNSGVDAVEISPDSLLRSEILSCGIGGETEFERM
jgi:hypothetical protein